MSSILSIVFFTAVTALAAIHPHICSEVDLKKELRVFKDPTLFVGILSQIYAEPREGIESLKEESPLRMVVKGKVKVRFEELQMMHNYGPISKLYEFVEPRLKKSRLPNGKDREPIRAVTFCGEDADSYSVGFVLEKDLQAALKDDLDLNQMPPSTPGNEIPRYSPK